MNFYTIPSTQSFCDVLASHIDRLALDQSVNLSQIKIFLPTRRAVRTLQEAFLRQTNGNPRILPIMQPIGDADTEEMSFSMSGYGDYAAAIKSPIDPMRRQLILARMLEKAWQGEYYYAQALDVAGELGRFIDQLHMEEKSIDGLADIIDKKDFAAHWQMTLDFLNLLLKELWPTYLRDVEGKIDPGTYRSERIKMLAQYYTDNPPHNPVIIAGSTGSIPATRQFIKTIGQTNNGQVILPALDYMIDDVSWLKMREGHPQFLLKKLLDSCRADRKEVRIIGQSGVSAHQDRQFVISEMMRPGESTEQWQGLVDPVTVQKITSGINGITRCDCETEDEEANVIALSMLEIAADKDQKKTATLITPDRNLAMRVQSSLAQWGILCDDSAGTPLAKTPIGRFLGAVVRVTEQTGEINPVPLLAALKSPMAGGGSRWGFDKDFRTLVRMFEKKVLRGVRPANGFRGMRTHVDADKDASIASFIDHLENIFNPLMSLASGYHALDDYLVAHIEVMENLAARPDMQGANRLWVGDAGECLAGFLSALQGQSDITPEMTFSAYAELIEKLITTQNVNPRYGSHPRLSILGQIEARMVKADRVILGGLNEGVWPPDTGFDTWMSRPMRTDFGLPALEQKITLAAHDFASAFGSTDLFITRSIRVGGQPSIAARWLQRLDTILTASGMGKSHWPQQKGAAYIRWARMAKGRFDEAVPVQRPEPKPPIAMRPLEFSVTDIERWIRDPYVMYVKRILKLKKLDTVDMDVTVADRGTLIHDVLEQFVTDYPNDVLPGDAYDKLIAKGRDVFAQKAEHPEIHGLWWPRFEKTASWFIPHEKDWRQNTQKIHSEVKCSLDITVKNTVFNLHGKADRLEKRKDGSWVVIDYKTGSAPGVGDVTTGIASQLPLEAYILMQGGFPVASTGSKIGDMQYWSLGGSGDGGQASPAAGKGQSDPQNIAEEAGEGVLKLIATFYDKDVPYLASPDPAAMIKLEYNEYAHLERIAEWSVIGDGGDQ